jgi:hypothetical protein
LGYDRGDFVFQVGRPQAPPPPPPPSVSFPPISEAAQAWAVTQGTTSVAVLEEFIRQFENTPYGPMARVRLEELKKSKLASVSPPTPTRPDNYKPAGALPPPRGPDDIAWDYVKDARDSSQLRRFMEQFPNSTHRSEAAEKLAALEQPPASTGSTPVDIARKLQAELRRVGCFNFDANGDWNADSRRALELFNKHAGATLDPKVASLDAFDMVRSKASRICPLVCPRGYHAEKEQCVATVCKAGYEVGDDGSCERTREHPRTGQYRYGPWQRDRGQVASPNRPANQPLGQLKGDPVGTPSRILRNGVRIDCAPAVQPCM